SPRQAIARVTQEALRPHHLDAEPLGLVEHFLDVLVGFFLNFLVPRGAGLTAIDLGAAEDVFRLPRHTWTLDLAVGQVNVGVDDDVLFLQPAQEAVYLRLAGTDKVKVAGQGNVCLGVGVPQRVDEHIALDDRVLVVRRVDIDLVVHLAVRVPDHHVGDFNLGAAGIDAEYTDVGLL